MLSCSLCVSFSESFPCSGLISVLELGLTVFGIGTNDLGARSQVSLTLLLTAVAYKFVIQETLPKVSYATMLDLYINFCFAFLFCINLANGIVSIIPFDQTADAAEMMDADSIGEMHALCRMHPQRSNVNVCQRQV